jgi:hypothetical protein
MSFNETTDDDPAVIGDRLIPGTHHSRSFTSSQIIGTAPYFVRIGTINFARVFTDDVAVRSRSIGRFTRWELASSLSHRNTTASVVTRRGP